MNHETKLVMLWIDNMQSAHNYWHNRAKVVYDNAKPSYYGLKYEVARYELAQCMKEKFSEDMYAMCDTKDVNGLWADLLSSALQDVEWGAVAESYLEDMRPLTNA